VTLEHSPEVDCSVVIPVYFNEGSLSTTFHALREKVFLPLGHLTFEAIFVDDGSGDGSYAELLKLRDAHRGVVRIIKLTRNFGQPAARLAGLRAARGRCVVHMTADGQDPPELIAAMLREHLERGSEIVIGNRIGRDEGWWRVASSRVFYGLMRRLSFPDMPPWGFDYVLVGRRALDIILRNQDASPFFQGQVLWTGFRPAFLPYRRLRREVGRSRWTFGKKVKLLIDGVFGYSFAPIRAISVMGLLSAIGGFGLAGAIVLRKLLHGTSVPGWAGIVVVMLVLGGVQMLMLGVIGEYVWRGLAESRRRDLYVIEVTHE
jgi:glycosyltransferase involved in cell wall biosynthesis